MLAIQNSLTIVKTATTWKIDLNERPNENLQSVHPSGSRRPFCLTAHQKQIIVKNRSQSILTDTDNNLRDGGKISRIYYFGIQNVSSRMHFICRQTRSRDGSTASTIHGIFKLRRKFKIWEMECEAFFLYLKLWFPGWVLKCNPSQNWNKNQLKQIKIKIYYMTILDRLVFWIQNERSLLIDLSLSL